MSLPSSTMVIRWPLPLEGYRTMASFMFTQEKNGAESNLLVTIPQTCVTKFII
jgi:hypothetical protein